VRLRQSTKKGKNLTQMANNAVGVVYNRLHHFLTESPRSDRKVNESGCVRRLSSRFRLCLGLNCV